MSFAMYLIPLICAGLLTYFLHVRGQGKDVAALFMLAALLPGVLVVAAVEFGGTYVMASDTEILSGEVTGKTRKHDSYTESYECNCRTSKDSRGNTTKTCDTCTRDHYTVKWVIQSTLGPFTVRSLDETSRMVYMTPDPARYAATQIGDPCSITNSYQNYVQTVDESLFAKKREILGPVPDYPDKIYDLYKIDRFLSPGFSFTDAAEWNRDISNMLRGLGKRKQVNVIVVVVKGNDPDYAFALQHKWEGANKNDVVVVLGSLDGRKVEYARVISWSKEEIFKIELQDRLLDLEIDRRTVLRTIAEQIEKNFVRRKMADFQYLTNEISLPWWALLLEGLLLVGAYSAVGFKLAEAPRYRRR